MKKIRTTHPGTTLNVKLTLFQLNEIRITGRGVVRAIEEEMKKEENRGWFSFYKSRRCNWLRILDEIENTINKE